MILLDTCVVSEVARSSPDLRVSRWFDARAPDELYLSALTLGEIKKGADLLDRGPRRERIEEWLDGLRRTFADRVLPIDTAIALRWGEVTAAARRAGRPRSPVDALIAATALEHGLVLATRNTRDFDGTGVRLLDPWI